jgi:DNA helicase II / ATP-dependent DNA helicase PcrA
LKKRQKISQAIPLPLFDQADFDDHQANIRGLSQPHQQEQSTTLLDDDMEGFQPVIDPERIPVYQEVSQNALLVHLNDPQRRAVTTTQGPVLILAGPGSGKTRVITHRIAYLILQERVKPRNILAMTFTNKAANEMRERLERMVGTHSRELVVTTFHSLCARMLRRSKEFLLRFGLTPSFSIADESDQERVLREVIRAPGMDLTGLDENQKTPGALRDLISQAKSNMRTPALLEAQAEQENKFSLRIVARIYHEYDRQLRKNGLLDFEDLLTFSVALLRSEPAIRAYYQQRWKYIHVDEFQDTNSPQYQVMRLLALGTDEQPGGYQNVCVVGDDDQMIYTWRGASIENLDRFERDFPQHTTILLEENYRSTKTIVQAASSVVQENLFRRNKHLWTANDQGDPVFLVKTETEDDEAQYVLNTTEQLMRTKAITRWSDVAVLYRTNAQSRAIEEAALQASIPYMVVGSTMFYQRKEIKDFLAYLRVLINEKDDISLERIINVPARGIGKATVSDLKEWASNRGLSLVEALSRLHEWTTLGRTAKQALAHFAQVLHTLRQAVDTCSLTELLDQVAQITGLEQALKEGTEEQQERWENVLELKRVASKFSGTKMPRALQLFLEHVTLMSGADQVEQGDEQKNRPAKEQQDAVTFITLHAAKGLEFDTVFLVGVEEGLLPHARTFLEDADDGSLEEERRLMYVGMSRAKRCLYCVRATRRFTFGRTVQSSPSRFLDAVPPFLTQTLSW